MKQIKLKEDAPWPEIKLPSGFIIKKDSWVDFTGPTPGFIGIEHLVDFQDIETEKPIVEKKRRKKESEVPDLPMEGM